MKNLFPQKYYRKPGTAILDRINPLANGLISAWLLNEEGSSLIAYDSCGNLNNGTLVALGATINRTVGPNGPVVSFNNVGGIGNLLKVGVSNLPLPNADASIAAWILSNGSATTMTPLCFNNGNLTTNQLAFVFRNGPFTIEGPAEVVLLTATSAPSTAVWHHYVYTYTKVGNTSRLYIDGALNTSSTATVSTAIWTAGNIGGSSASNHDFTGQVESVLYYNRPLSASEVEQLYAFPYDFLI